MPDLNELLAWATANSTQPQGSEGQGQQLSLNFRPADQASNAGTSALHPSDAGYTPSADASTPNAPGDTSRAKREDLTTEMLDFIMGKGDSIVMKEKMAIATDESKTVEERTEALDDFEMLIELIDNANNMPILKLWEPLLGLLKSPEQPIVAHALWIIGTAVQNNLKAQAALYVFNAFPLILDVLYPTDPSVKHYTSTRAKAAYALSAALKHWPLANTALSADSNRGYDALKAGVTDAESVIRRKTSFLVGTLTMQSGERHEGEIPSEVVRLIEENTKASTGPAQTLVEGLKTNGVYEALIESVGKTDDVESQENGVRALSYAAPKDGLTSEQKASLKSQWPLATLEKKFDLSEGEAKDIVSAF